MLNDESIVLPTHYQEILEASGKINFGMPSDLKTGSLLRTLAASKPGGRFLEIGTGTGLSLAWLAEGADRNSAIISIDNTAEYQQIAAQTFIYDKRITLTCVDGSQWLDNYAGEKFDLIFADAWPGKFEKLDHALTLVKPGGFYLVDDLLPQPNWPEGHAAKADALIEVLRNRQDFVYTVFNWSTGLILFTKVK